ncbi:MULTISPECIES: DUF6113 family protein [Streptomyces]|uniref:Integral membrane protein n=1 Tax=Streptomyces lycii TaxID=2654337 RepID=A0ABQ7FPT4_9ACTN|nr:DUF6113 family protein [Streptomyces lycii]KAF4410399.1 hypothetical protein GCU69_03985 [Streptomyces lycii]
MSAGRIAVYAGLAVLGVLTGVAGAVVQAAWFPGGLLLALLGVGALCYGGTKATGTRVGAGAPAGGWMLAVLLLTTARPEGDFLFGAGVGSYIFMLGGMLTAVMCATLPSLPPPGPRTPRLGE